MTDNAQAGHYAPMFKAWQVKVLGSKPTPDMLATVHGLGLRAGKQALANAMALRPEGVSGAQIVMACGAPQLNRMRGLIGAGVVKRDMNVSKNAQGHTVYKLTLTPRGEAAIKRATDAAAKAALPVTAKPAKPAKPKARKPRTAKPADVPAPVPVAPVTTDAPVDVQSQA